MFKVHHLEYIDQNEWVVNVDKHKHIGGVLVSPMVEIQTGFRENTIGMLEQFTQIASVDPIVGALLFVGTVLMIVSIGIFGILTIGAIVSSLR